MSFRKIQFKFNPPPTLATDTQPVQRAAAAPVTAATVPAPRAQLLIEKYERLGTIAEYLKQAVRERSAGIAVTIDPKAQPEVAQALARIYGVETPPPGISAEMYSHLVAADVSIVRADLALGDVDHPTVQVSPIERADLGTVTSIFEDAMVDNGDFPSQIPILLRQLEGDQVIFDNVKSGLSQYSDTTTPMPDQSAPSEVEKLLKDNPALLDAPPADPIDVSAPVYEILDQRADLWQSYYAATYDLIAGVDKVYAGIHDLNNRFIEQPVATLLKLIAMLNALRALFHKPTLAQIRKSLVWFVLPRMIAEISGYTMILDRLVQKATSPVLALFSSLGNLFGEVVRDVEQAAWLADGGLTGLVKQQIHNGSTTVTAPPPTRIKELEAIPHALKEMTSGIAWSVNKTRQEAQYIQATLVKVMDRRLGGTAQRLDVMKSLSGLDALVNITRSIVLSSQQMAGTPFAQSQVGNLTSAQTVLNQAIAGGNLTAVVNGSTVVLSQPNVSAPPANVAAMLKDAGSEVANDQSTVSVPLEPGSAGASGGNSTARLDLNA